MIKSITVDDEPKAIEVIGIHASKIPCLKLSGTFTDPAEALIFLKSNYVDLIFLDINMPGINGLDFIRNIEYTPFIIFTTAYSEYAIESYDYEAVDYLLKPIEFDRFYKAVQKVEKRILQTAQGLHGIYKNSFFVKDGYKKVMVNSDDILYIKSEGNYLQVVCSENKIMVRMTYREIMEKISGNHFIRIHMSYMINLHKISKIENNHVFINGIGIPIGITYKEEFEKHIARL
jgi:two-component system, LytTR family, response regulator